MKKLATALLVTIVFKMFDGGYIYSTATELPDVASGRTVAAFNHAKYIYITTSQKERLGPTHWSNFFIYGLLVLVAIQKSRLMTK